MGRGFSLRSMKDLQKRFKKNVYIVLRKIHDFKLTMNIIMRHKIFSSVPYQKPGSSSFFKAVKAGDVEEVEAALRVNQYLVYDFDKTRESALHWAGKRGHKMITYLLLKYGADPDFTDMAGRTPLFLAAKAGHLICVKLLLLHRANPSIRSDARKTAVDYATKYDVIQLITTSHKMHILLDVQGSRKSQEDNWNRGKLTFFTVKEEELHDHLPY